MADYMDVHLDQFTFTLREAQWARPDELGTWRRANCTRCGEQFELGQDNLATDFLHRLHQHSLEHGRGDHPLGLG